MAAPLRGACACLLPLLALLLMACETRREVHPITYWNGSPWARATVNETLGTFLIDTGAGMTVLDAEFAERAGVRHDGTQHIIATTGEITLATGWARTVGFLGRKHERRFVSIQDLSSFRAPGGIRQSGLIGTDFLIDYTLVFQMDESTAFLHPGPGPAGEGMIGFAFQLRDGTPTIDVEFPGPAGPLRAWGKLDTGSAYSDESMVYFDMDTTLARRVLGSRLDGEPDATTMVRSLAGVWTVRLYDHGPIRLLGREIEDVRLAVHDHGEGFFGREGLLISGNLLARFPRMEIDFPRRMVWVPRVRPVLP